MNIEIDAWENSNEGYIIFSEENYEAQFRIYIYKDGKIDLEKFMFGKIKYGNKTIHFQNAIDDTLLFIKKGRGRLSERIKKLYQNFFDRCIVESDNIKVNKK